jgi:DNA primase
MGEIRRTRDVYIAEGYMDVIALHQAGVTNAVAPLGTAFTEEQAKLLKRWATRAFIVFDADDAGQRAAEKAILTCRRNGLICAIVEPAPAAKDPADLLKDAGPDSLREAMTRHILDIEYLLRRLRTRFDIATNDGKSGAVAALFPYLEALDSAVARDAAVERIAAVFSADRAAVLADFARKAPVFRRDGAQTGGAQAARAAVKAAPIRMNDELYILIAVAVNQRLYPRFRSELSIEEIETTMAKELFITLEECCQRDEFGMADLLDRIESDALRAFVIEKAVSKEFTIDPERFIERGIGKFKRRRLEKRIQEIIVEMHIENAQAEPSPRYEELFAEKMRLDEELYRLKTSDVATS